MNKIIVIMLSFFAICAIAANAFNFEKINLSPEQLKINNYAAEIDNLNYQLNQCKLLYGGQK